MQCMSITYPLSKKKCFFGNFPGNFLILVSNLVPLWSEHTLHNLNLAKFIETI